MTVTVNRGYTVKPIEDPPPPPKSQRSENPRPPKKSNRFLFILLGAAVIIIAEAIALIMLSAKADRLEKAYMEDEEYIAVQASRVFEYFGEKDVVHYNDPTYGDTWLQALTDVPKGSFDFKTVREENGLKHYYEDGERITKAGIDVSYHQGSIDWERVHAAGIDFVMLRVGYRGYETGKITIDDNFHSYAQTAEAAGLEVGVYFYSQAISEKEALEEAEAVLAEIDGYNVTYPVVFDWEIVGEETARTNDVTAATLNDCAYAFCNRIAEAGYIPMIYSTSRMAMIKFDLSRLAGFDFWLAQYRDEPDFPYQMHMWQYASDGSVDGIEGEVDLNMSFMDYSKVRQNHPMNEDE